MIVEGWAENQSVQLHYLDSGGDAAIPLVPIVFISGLLGSAEDYVPDMPLLEPRRCIAISLRGRGKSEAPETGYSFDDHVADIEAVIDKIGLRIFCLMAFSASVAYAIGYAFRHPELLAGLIIGDYPARYPKFSPEWVDHTLAAFRDRVKPHVARALQRESAEMLLWEGLEHIKCPALIIRGGQPGSILTEEKVKMYLQRLRNAKDVVFEGSGHEFWKPDYNRAIRTIKAFLEQIDSSMQQNP